MATNAMTLEAIMTIICVRSLGDRSGACPVLSREDPAAEPIRRRLLSVLVCSEIPRTAVALPIDRKSRLRLTVCPHPLAVAFHRFGQVIVQELTARPEWSAAGHGQGRLYRFYFRNTA